MMSCWKSLPPARSRGDAGQIVENPAREARHRNRRAGRVHRPRQRVHDRYRQHARAVVQIRNRVEAEDLLDVSEALVIAEEEDFVLDDRAADRAAELVALQRRLHAAGGLEVPDRIQARVAEKLV